MNFSNKRRDFLKNSAFSLLALGASSKLLSSNFAFAKEYNHHTEGTDNVGTGKFVLPKLKYGFADLEPYIDTLTMQIHYGKHHQAYVDNLNKAIPNTKFANLGLEETLKSLSGDKSENAVRNNAGGHYNHTFFWDILTKKQKSKTATGKLLSQINKDFGSVDKFITEFDNAAKTRFGSGWAWLIWDKQENKLKVGSTANQDNPLMPISELKGEPIIGLDVWEHAYYLKYQNRRPEYVNAFWNVIDWDHISQKFEKL